MKKIILSLCYSILFVASLSFAQLDSVKNFAQGTLASGINSSSTKMVLVSGNGARFPLSGYNVTIWDWSGYGANINAAYRAGKTEIVRVAANSGDTLTVMRAQEGTSAVDFNISGHVYYVAQIITAKTIADIRTSSAGLSDSAAALRTQINKNIDSIFVHRNQLNSLQSSVGSLLLLDSVDIVITTIVGASFGAQTTNYVPLGGTVGVSTVESSVETTPFGVNGLVKEMYVQARTNTESASSTITLQFGESDAATLTESNLVVTLAAASKNGSVTNKRLVVTPKMVGDFKFVNSSGSGAIGHPAITIVIRVPIN